MANRTGLAVCVMLCAQYALYARLRTGFQREACDSTILLVGELIKLAVSLVAARRLADKEPLDVDAASWTRAAVPTLLFAVMNAVSMWAARLVGTTTFVVVMQTKLLWTALFQRFMRGRRVSAQRGLALASLALGCALATVVGGAPDRGAVVPGLAAFGVAALLAEAAMSGFSSVYIQGLFDGSEKCMWTRNAQLAIMSVALYATRSISANCSIALTAPVDWALATLGALGGILVALAILHAGALEKTVATSASVALAVAADLAFSAAAPPIAQCMAAAVVVVAVLQFALPEATPADCPRV